MLVTATTTKITTTTTTITATFARLLAKVKKSNNKARHLEFSLFSSICHVEYMSACLIENSGFLKFFTETDSIKQKRAMLENITQIVI